MCSSPEDNNTHKLPMMRRHHIKDVEEGQALQIIVGSSSSKRDRGEKVVIIIDGAN